MDVRTVHEWNSLFSCVMAMFLNSVLLWLVWKRAPKEMEVYSRILIQTVLVDFALAIVVESGQPMLFMNADGWVIVCFNNPLVKNNKSAFVRFLFFSAFLFLYMFAMFGLSVQFVYRYLVLAKGAHISMPRYLAMLCVPAIAELVMCFIFYICAMPTVENGVVQGAAASHLLGDEPIYVALIAKSTDVILIANTAYLMSMQVICYTLIAICGYLVVKYVRQNTKLNPSYKEMNAQLTLNLILQSILPCILCSVNVAILACVIIVPTSVSSSKPVQLFSLLDSLPMHWLPMFNPMITIVVVKPFRRALMFWRKTQTVALVKNVAPRVAFQRENVRQVMPKSAIRPRVRTISESDRN